MLHFEKELSQIKSLIESNTRFLLINHIRMDPDAFGSLGGFYLLLKKLEKKVYAVNDDSIPENFKFLSNDIVIQQSLRDFDPEVIISFDAASLDQLGKSYSDNKKIFEQKAFIVIDHHITNPGFGNINIIDTKSSSSCELVYDIICELGYQDHIDKPIATLLLAGIHTDTNTFYNKNTTSHTLEIAGKLIDLGAENKEIIFQFFRKKSLEKVKLWGEIMQKVQQESGVSFVSVKKDIYEDTLEKDQGFKGFINEFLANIEGTLVALFLYEEENGSIKVSLRSNRDDIDVTQICGDFGGGGHKLAAGFSSSEDIETLEKMLLEKIKSLV